MTRYDDLLRGMGLAAEGDLGFDVLMRLCDNCGELVSADQMRTKRVLTAEGGARTLGKWCYGCRKAQNQERAEIRHDG